MYSELLMQEKQLCFDSFTEETAWELGSYAVNYIKKHNLPVAIRIDRGDQILFQFSASGTTADNDLWLMGKSNVVHHFQHSSYYISRKLLDAKTDITRKYHLPPDTYRAKGGAVPIWTSNSGLAGVLTISGLKDIDDHNLAVEIITTFLSDRAAV